MEPIEVVSLDPSRILADENARFGLKKERIEAMTESILEKNGVMVPVEVEPLEDNADFDYKLTMGHYRLAGIVGANEAGAGLLLPAIVRPIGDSVERLKRQLAENVDRENMTPMDTAVAMRKLVEAGITKMEIRKIFQRPGGRKGMKMQPASNSFVNMTLSFLDLPKKIQTKIHEGRIGVSAAYELTKVTPDKRDQVLEAAEAAVIKQFEKEEQEEEKFLENEKKAAELLEKQDLLAKEVDEAKKKHEAAIADLTAKNDKAAELYKAAKAKIADAAAKKEAEEALKAAEAESREAEKATVAALKEVSKLEGKAQTAAQQATERAEKLKQARLANKGAQKSTVSGQDVKKAAASTGASKNYVALNATEMRAIVRDLALPGFPKVQAIGLAIKSCFDGVTTDAQLLNALLKLTGEKKADKVKEDKAA